jgi:hypothetical protein
MTKQINLFDFIIYGCRTHPTDVIYDTQTEFCVYFENYSDNAKFDTLRELVELQGSNWEWYCKEFNANINDEKWGRW